MKRQVLMVGLVASVFMVSAVLAEDPAGQQPTPVQAAPTATEGTTFTEAEMAAADRLRTAYPGIEFLRVNTILSRIWGRSFGMGDSADQVATRFLEENADLFGAVAADLLPITPILPQGNQLPLLYDPETGTYRLTLLYYSQYRDGVPVFRAGIRLLVENQPGHPLVWAGSNLKRLEEFHPDPSRANSVNPAQIAPDMLNFTPPEPVIWAGINADTLLPRQAVTFEADNYGSGSDKPEKWLYVVDAGSGEVLYKENHIIFTDVNGIVQGKATTLPKSDDCNPEENTPMKHAKVSIGTTTAYTDANGIFSIPNSGTSQVTVTSYVAGQYFTVDNYAGAEETMTTNVTPPGPANFTHNAANTSEPVRAQTNGYVQANIVRDWVLTYHPTYPTISTQTNFPVYVNRTGGYCPGNAWYDYSSINFCSSGSGYPNTAYSSVVHHEYGHHMCQVAGTGQEEYGEGVGDSVGVCIADDPTLGYGFEGDCNAGLRTADNTFQYPCSGEIHYCGQLLSGCVWSTRNELQSDFPSNYLTILSSLLINSIPMHAGSSDIDPSIFTDWITLDNAMGGLHTAQIYAGFQAHNMAPVDVLAPTPNPMTFAVPPCPVPGSSTSMTMTATTGTDIASPPVRYYFDFVSGGAGGTNSAWQSNTTYVDTGLLPNTLYTYQVQARDSAPSPNYTGISPTATGVTNIQTPAGVTFGAVTTGSIVLNAAGALSNLMAGQSGVYFDSTTPGGSGGINAWLKVTTDTATGLAPNTSYTFQAKARNMYGVETPYCSPATKFTLANAPVAPTLTGATKTTLSIQVNANGNPADTEFAIRCTAGNPSDSTWVGKYVDASGAPSDSAVWQTATQWAATTITGLESCTDYTFAVKARNGDADETAFGDGASLSTAGRQGDLNGDDAVDGADIQDYVSCVIAGGGEECACATGVNIATFVNCLLDAGTCP